MNTKLKILYLEDSPRDAEIVHDLLQSAGFAMEVDVAPDKQEYEKFLATSKYDIILSDFNLPGYDGKKALEMRNRMCSDIPFICISGTIGEEIAIDLLKLGANDYVLKDRLERLPFAIKRAIEEAKEKAALNQMHEKLDQSSANWSKTFDSIQDGIFLLDADQKIIEANQTFLDFVGKSREEIIGQHCWPFVHNTQCQVENCPFVKSQTSKKREITELKMGESEYEVMIDPIIDKDNQLSGAVHIIADITERKKAEKLLAESEYFFKESQRAGFIGSYKSDFIKGYWESSEVLDKIFGIDKDYDRSIPGWLEIIHPDDREMMNRYLSVEVISKHNPFNKEYRILRLNDGETRWVMGLGQIDANDEGKVISMTGTIQDITERKLAEQVIMIEKELYIDLVKSMPSGVYRVRVFSPEKWKKNAWKSSENAPYIMELISDRYCEILGVSRETITKNPGILNDLVHPEEKDVFAKLNEEANSSLNKFHWEGRIVNDGNIRWVSLESLPRVLENGDVIWTGSIQDITERKQIENLIKERESSLQYAQEIAKMGSWEWDVASNKVEWSENYYAFFGLNPLEVEPSFELFRSKIHPDDVAFFDEKYGIVFNKQNPGNFEHRIILADGTIKWIQNNVVPIIVDDKLIKLKGAFIDITERKQAEDILAKNFRELSILNQFSIKLAMLSPKDNLESTITKAIKEITAAEVVVYSNYNPADHSAVVKEIEMEPGLMKKAIGLLGKQVKKMQSEVTDEAYLEITNDIIVEYKTLHEASLGTVSRPVSAAIQALLKIDRFISVAFMLDGVLYGTSMLAMKKEQADISRDIFENLINMATVSLRRKKAEDALKGSESSLHYAQEIAKMGSWKLDTVTQKTVWSENSFVIYGYKPFEFVPTFEHFKNRVYPDDWHIIEEAFDDIYKNKTEHKSEIRIVLPDGNIKWLQINMVPLFNNDKLVELIGTNIDITERKLAELALKESEALFATTFNSLPIPVSLSDIDTDKWVEVNDAFLNITGYTRKEIIGHTFHEINLWKNEEDRENMRSILVKEGRVSEIKVEINKKNGETGVMLISVEKVELSGKKYLLIMGNEITARLKTEAKLKESELRYRTLYKNSPSGILVLDENGIILEANEEIAKTSLYSPDELVGSDVRRLTRPDDSYLVAENIQRILAGEVLEHEFISKRKDGTFYNLNMKETAIALPNGQRGVLSVSNDITQRKQAEIALLENNTRLKLAMSVANMAWWEMDLTNGNVIFDKRKTDMLGYAAEKFTHYKDFMALVHPNDYENAMKAMRLHIDGLSDIYEVEYRIANSSGEFKWFYDIGTIIKRDEAGLPLKVTGLVTDISRRKQTEEAMIESESSLRYAQEIAKMGNWEWDTVNKKTIWSPNYYAIFGLDPSKVKPGLELFRSTIYQEDVTFFDETYAMICKEQKSKTFDLRIVQPDGNIKWLQNFVVPFYEDDKLIKLKGVFIDITERKQTERMMHDIIEKNPISIQIVDKEGFTLKVNPAHTKLFGAIPPPEFSVFSDTQLRQQDLTETFKRLRKGEVVNFPDSCFNAHDLNPSFPEADIWVRAIAFPLNESQQKPNQFVIMHENITEQKKNEIALKDSEEKYRVFIDSTSDLVFLKDDNFRYIIANKSMCAFYNITDQEIFGKTDFELMDKSYALQCQESDKKALSTNKVFITEEIMGNKSFETVKFPVEYSDGKIGVGGFIKDITGRKQAEEALIASEEKYRNIFENVQDVFYQTDLAGIVLEISPSIKYFTEFTRDDIVGKPVHWLYYNPDDRAILINELQKNGELKDYELILKPKKGEKMYVSINARLIMDDQGQPHHIDGALRNISERKQSEKVIRESEERFRKVFEKSQIGMVIAAPNLQFEKVNPAFCNMMGYTSEELTSMSFIDITHHDEIQSGMDKIKTVGQGEIPFYKVEKRYITKYGKVIRVNVVITNVRDKDGKLLYYLAMIEDITERRLAEEKLLASKDYLEKIINTVAYPIFVKDEEHKYYLVNTALCEMFGQSKEDIIGKSDYDFISEEQAKEFLIKDNEVYDSGKESKIEEEITDGTGIVKTLITTKTLYTDKDGKKFLVAIINDISERKQMELDLIKAKDKAEESDRLKSAFLANMSHEIRTPMNGILGFAELLKEPKLSGDKQQEFISIIEKSGVRLLNIINDLVNISKIESGLMNVYLSEVNINDQIEYIYKFFKPELERKGFLFSSKMGLSSNEAIVKTDREKIIAILTNLVGNAMKFTDKGSIEFGYNKKDNQLEFFVKDTGRGILSEQKEYIFERFRQGSESLSRNYEGAGLGLSISRSYVKMLGGKIWVESNGEKGSTFYFTIPYNIQPKEKVVISKKVIPKEKEFQKIQLKILIAEDDEISLLLLKSALDILAKEILIARTGKEAVDICRNNIDIDLILMDLKMPEMDGYEAMRQIRQFNHDVIIIAQTAFGLIGDREKAIEAGSDDYISKPINVSKLEELIIKHFNRK